MAPKFRKLKPFEEPVLEPENGIVQPPVMPPPNRRCRRTNVLDKLSKLMTKIWKRTWAYIFHKPVDAKKRGMTDYHQVIKRPMDLGTIKKRLANNYYRQSDEAIADFKLVYENCLQFNAEGTVFHKRGLALKSFFNENLAKIDLTKEMVVRRKSRKQKPPRNDKPRSPPKKLVIKFNPDAPWKKDEATPELLPYRPMK